MDDLQTTSQGPPTLEFDGQLKNIPASHEQTAFEPDTVFTDIEDLARR